MAREETFWGIFMETLPALLISGLFAIIPGFFLTIYASELSKIIGLLTLIPAIIGMRGNVFGSFCAHMSSLHHLKLSIISDSRNNTELSQGEYKMVRLATFYKLKFKIFLFLHYNSDQIENSLKDMKKK